MSEEIVKIFFGISSAFVLFIVLASTQPNKAGYTCSSTGCYKVHTNPKNATEARHVCLAEGASLAVINSQEEAENVSQLLESVKSQISGVDSANAFVGFYRSKDGKFVTESGEPLSSTGYEKFFPGDPNNRGGQQNCGAIRSLNGQLGLDDVNCFSKYAYICEINE